jgi:hypothetical protein
MIKVCWSCNQELSLASYNKNSSEKDGHQKFCRQCQREYGRKLYHKNKQREQERCRAKYRILKEEVFNHYGGSCVCCGESILDFLAMDHIDNDGAEHRKEAKITGGIRMYYWLKRNNFPNNFQVLCHNCNWSKHANGGTCIHQLSHEEN